MNCPNCPPAPPPFDHLQVMGRTCPIHGLEAGKESFCLLSKSPAAIMSLVLSGWTRAGSGWLSPEKTLLCTQEEAYNHLLDIDNLDNIDVS